ncbi:MAG TPA: beta-ketoacyl synthase chain length factor [Bacteroidales bacterium]|nr:beta-ketoacyl synthase chain length factor [Bacteroidales bacterium]
MSTYISGIGCISPQKTIGNHDFLAEPVNHSALFLQCIQPESYRDYIDPLLARRLSRIIKMGITSAVICLKDSGVEMPGAIITGTGLGSVKDTEKFLTTMLDNNETLLNPTNFMQSTYNTISSQIAIILKCANYNSTYVHRGFSFESALIDGLDLMQRGEADSALVGGIDEISENHYNISGLLGLWRQQAENHLDMLKNPGKGTIPGEGSVYFTLTKDIRPNSYARLDCLKTLYKPKSITCIHDTINNILKDNNLSATDIDLFVAGLNGDDATDKWYHSVINEIFDKQAVAAFKHFCGEYYTASAFGLWLASTILKQQHIPPVALYRGNAPRNIRRILLYNHYAGEHHSIMLITSV